MKIRPAGAKDGLADRYIEYNSLSFRNFANVPKNGR